MAQMPSLEVKEHVVILRTHSDYVTKLASQLSSLLATIESTLNEPNAHAETVVKGEAEQLADVRKLLAQEADIFCVRLKDFLEILASSE